jgi:hypothetical protein
MAWGKRMENGGKPVKKQTSRPVISSADQERVRWDPRRDGAPWNGLDSVSPQRAWTQRMVGMGIGRVVVMVGVVPMVVVGR